MSLSFSIFEKDEACGCGCSADCGGETLGNLYSGYNSDYGTLWNPYGPNSVPGYVSPQYGGDSGGSGGGGYDIDGGLNIPTHFPGYTSTPVIQATPAIQSASVPCEGVMIAGQCTGGIRSAPAGSTPGLPVSGGPPVVVGANGGPLSLEIDGKMLLIGAAAVVGLILIAK